MAMAEGDGPSFQSLMRDFNSTISKLQQLLNVRSAAPGRSSAELGPVDIVVQAIEQQLKTLKAHLRNEAEGLPKAEALIQLSLHQERKLKHMLANLPSHLPGFDHCSEQTSLRSGDCPEVESTSNEGPAMKSTDNAQKDKKGRSPPPRWYVTVDELDALSSYMRGRLTLDKINAAVDEMATYAEANARLLAAPRKKLGEDLLEKVLELRDFAFSEAMKGKHFFLESDMRGPVLKLDNTGKAILTVLRHLGRILDVRTGRQRAFVLKS